MARYRLLKRGVLDTDTGRAVEPVLSDPAWEEYLAWFAAGNVPDPIAPRVPAPPDLSVFYRRMGSARDERQMAKLSNEEFIDLLRRGKR